MISIPEKIQTGELDLYLTKPVNPLLRITFEKSESRRHTASDIQCMYHWIWSERKRNESFLCECHWIFGYGSFDDDTILRYGASATVFCLFVFSVNNLMKIENTAMDLCMKIPGIAFDGIYKLFFYFILPYGVIATLPTQALIGALSAKGLIFGAAIVCIFTFIALFFWTYGVHRYESASS